MTRALGGDPGTLNLGLGIVDVSSAGRRLVSIPHIDLSSRQKPEHRLSLIAQTLAALAPTVDVFAVEDQTGAYFGAAERGETNAHAARNMGVVDLFRGIAAMAGIGFVIVRPAQLRRDLGLQRGASKDEVERAVRARVSGIPEDASSHSIDAIGFAIIGGRRWEVEAVIERSRQRLNEQSPAKVAASTELGIHQNPTKARKTRVSK